MPLEFLAQSVDYVAQQAGKLDYGDLPSSSKLRNPIHAHLATLPVTEMAGDAGQRVVAIAELPIGARILPHLCHIPDLTSAIDVGSSVVYYLVLLDDLLTANEDDAVVGDYTAFATLLATWTKNDGDTVYTRTNSDAQAGILTTRTKNKVALVLFPIAAGDSLAIPAGREAVIAYQLP